MWSACQKYGEVMERTGEVGLIAVGGALGALVRFLVAEAFPSTAFPWSTFAVNLIGCALLALSLIHI